MVVTVLLEIRCQVIDSDSENNAKLNKRNKMSEGLLRETIALVTHGRDIKHRRGTQTGKRFHDIE